MDTQTKDWQVALQIWLEQHPKIIPDHLRRLREDFVRKFPIKGLEDMTLDQYAVGKPDSFCYWLEFKTKELGDIRGGSAAKFGVWWSKSENRWRWNSFYQNAEDALAHIKQGLLALIDATRFRQFDDLDKIGRELLGPNSNSLRGKPLYLYFPEYFLPISNPEHLEHFLKQFGEQPKGDLTALNRQLLTLLKASPQFEGFDTYQMMKFLYETQQPNLSEAVLINQRVIPYLQNLGYKYLEHNPPVSIGTSKVRADIVVYSDQDKAEPHIVVEATRKLPNEVTLLDPAVQQAFTLAASLGDSVRYLLITDGYQYHWFERRADGSSLVQLSDPPQIVQETNQGLLLSKSLVLVTDPEQFTRLIQDAMQALSRQGRSYVNGLRVGIGLNRILIAKLYDEQVILAGGNSNFSSDNTSAEPVTLKIERLYEAALAHLGGTPTKDWDRFFSPDTLQTVVELFEPYALSSVTPSIRGHLFWQALYNSTKVEERMFTTPVPLAELLVELVRPRQGERVIDPACGTGLFLIESLKYMQAKSLIGEKSPYGFGDSSYNSWQNVLGVERNAEVAELAATNLVLNDISPKQIIRANTLDRRELEKAGIELGSYDIVLLDPPMGGRVPSDEQILRQYEVNRHNGKITSEMLFIERAIELARPGGVLALLVPDSLLTLPDQLHARTWILNRTTPKAIISLPPDAYAPTGFSVKTTILLLKKNASDVRADDTVLVADVRSIGYDRFGQTMGQSDLPSLIEAVRTFLETGRVEVSGHGGKFKVWTITVNELSDKRLDVLQLNPADRDILLALDGSRYPAVRLDQMVDIISGNNFKRYVEKGPGTAVVLQAGSIRDLELDLSTAPSVSQEDYNNSKRAQVKVGDVLVTTTGQYLGRAVAIDDSIDHAVASGAVTILRPLPESEINPFFLAAVICSDVGKKQISQRAFGAAQPYVRRTDLGTILIPLPNLRKQGEIVARIKELLRESYRLARQVRELESTAKQLVVNELLEGDYNE